MTFGKLSLVFNQLHSLQFTTVCDVPSVDSCITGKKKRKIDNAFQIVSLSRCWE